MSDETYTVVLTGSLEAGWMRTEVIRTLAQRFQLTLDTAEKLLTGNEVAVKRRIDAVTADKFQQAILASGAHCKVIAETPEHAELMGNIDFIMPTTGSSNSLKFTPGAPPPDPTRGVTDPYAPPRARLLDVISDEGVQRSKRVSMGRGFGWLLGGLGLFWQAKLAWFLVWLVFGLIAIVSSFVPLLGPIAFSIVFPILLGGIMLGANQQHHGGNLALGDLFLAFSSRPWLLAGVGVIYLSGTVVTTFLMGGFMAMTFGSDLLSFSNIASGDVATAFGNNSAGAMMVVSTVLIFFVLTLACLIPLYMLLWFAPALLTLNGELGLMDAMRLSFRGCLKNSLPFLLYGMGLMLLAFLASIPLLLGWVIAGPIMLASHYVSYREIYVE